MDSYLSHARQAQILLDEAISPGQSFEPALRKALSGCSGRVDLRIGDIVTLAHTDRPVEIAFYDCLKDARRDLAVFNAFAPRYTSFARLKRRSWPLLFSAFAIGSVVAPTPTPIS